MEADWSVALAADDPEIVVPWARFIDLRQDRDRVDEIEEARSEPALTSALLLLNSAGSPLWTAKCDTWNSSEPMDPYEMDAEPADAACGAGSYIDLLTRNNVADFERLERWIRVVAERLRTVPAKASRVELVLRRARVNEAPGYGTTWFVEGCGATPQRARQAWNEALRLALPVIMHPELIELRESGR